MVTTPGLSFDDDDDDDLPVAGPAHVRRPAARVPLVTDPDVDPGDEELDVSKVIGFGAGASVIYVGLLLFAGFTFGFWFTLVLGSGLILIALMFQKSIRKMLEEKSFARWRQERRGKAPSPKFLKWRKRFIWAFALALIVLGTLAVLNVNINTGNITGGGVGVGSGDSTGPKPLTDGQKQYQSEARDSLAAQGWSLSGDNVRIRPDNPSLGRMTADYNGTQINLHILRDPDADNLVDIKFKWLTGCWNESTQVLRKLSFGTAQLDRFVDEGGTCQ